MLIAIDFRNPKWLIFIEEALNIVAINSESVAANQRAVTTAEKQIVFIVNPGVNLLSCEREDHAFRVDYITPAILPLH